MSPKPRSSIMMKRILGRMVESGAHVCVSSAVRRYGMEISVAPRSVPKSDMMLVCVRVEAKRKKLKVMKNSNERQHQLCL